MDLNHGIGEEKEADEFARLFSVYMSLYIHGFPVLMCRFVPCLWMRVKERVHPSASITVTWREVDCVCVVR